MPMNTHMFDNTSTYVECGSWTYIPEGLGGLNDGDRYHRQNTEEGKMKII